MRVFVIPVALALGLGSASAHAMDYAKTTETTVNLGHGLYAIIATNPDPSSGIGDTTVAVGRDALIVVDTQFAQLHDMLKSKITAISPLPVKYAINSHFHGDHSGGNAAFAKDGAIIVAHENALKAMEAGKNTPTQALPAQTYSGHATQISIPRPEG
jgi:cyclase